MGGGEAARAAVAAALLTALLVTFRGGPPAAAQPAPPQASTAPAPAAPAPPTREQQARELNAAWKAAEAVATHGPANVPLRDEATLQVPAGMEFIPRDAAVRISRASGNTPGEDLIGFVNPLADSSKWLVAIRFDDEGHVSDSEADQLDPAALLTSLREGAAESNRDRVQRGFPEIELLDWSQPPRYDAARRRLTWALPYRLLDGTAQEGAGLNFNTRMLGRDGYFSLNLLSAADRLAGDQAEAEPVLAGLRYADGKRYEDYNAGTDKLATYGLLGLIGVVAAKKIGIIALAGAFLLKFAKVGLIAVLGLGAAARRLFRRAPRA